MKLNELVTLYERRASDADAIGATAPIANVYRRILHELRQVGATEEPRLMTTNEAAAVLGCSRRTVARWCEAGLFDGAKRVSSIRPSQGDGGRSQWRIPSKAVYEKAGIQPNGGG